MNPFRLRIWILLVLASCNGGDTEDTWDELPLRDRCFEGLGDESKGLPDYDQFDPVVGRHCSGTDHQDIEGVEQVVFLGDSVTVGTPPTDQEDFYRSLLADALAEEFGLEKPGWLWQAVNLIERGTTSAERGVALSSEAGNALEAITTAIRASGERIHEIVAAVHQQVTKLNNAHAPPNRMPTIVFSKLLICSASNSGTMPPRSRSASAICYTYSILCYA